MDILGYINTQEPVVNWTSAKKTAFLDSLAKRFKYAENTDSLIVPPSKKAYVNHEIERRIKGWVNGQRKKDAEKSVTYDEIDFT